MAGKINTNKVLNNRWNTGGGQVSLTGTISINSDMSSEYDYALTDDPILLNDRKDTANQLYQIFKTSSYFKKYSNSTKKVDKDDIFEIFYYFKNELKKKKTVSAYEFMLSINEFFDFNYDYIWNNVASVDMKSEILEDMYKNMGKREEMEHQIRLF